MPDPKYPHQNQHPHLIGFMSAWRVTGAIDSNQDNFVNFVAAHSALEACQFVIEQWPDVQVSSVVQVAPLEITRDVLNSIVAVYKQRSLGTEQAPANEART